MQGDICTYVHTYVHVSVCVVCRRTYVKRRTDMRCRYTCVYVRFRCCYSLHTHMPSLIRTHIYIHTRSTMVSSPLLVVQNAMAYMYAELHTHIWQSTQFLSTLETPAHPHRIHIHTCTLTTRFPFLHNLTKNTTKKLTAKIAHFHRMQWKNHRFFFDSKIASMVTVIPRKMREINTSL